MTESISLFRIGAPSPAPYVGTVSSLENGAIEEEEIEEINDHLKTMTAKAEKDRVTRMAKIGIIEKVKRRKGKRKNEMERRRARSRMVGKEEEKKEKDRREKREKRTEVKIEIRIDIGKNEGKNIMGIMTTVPRK